MCAMDSLIKSCVWVLLITGISGRSLLSQTEISNSTDESLSSVTETSNSTEDYLIAELQGDCNWRYYQHYHIKGCQVSQVDVRGCPISYSCPSPANVSYAEPKVCVYKNVEYQVGDKIELNDKCKICRCSGGDDVRITCVQRECPQMDPVDGQNCHLVYEENKCCPSRYECASYSDGINNLATSEFACTYNDVQYPLGSKIYPSEDVCLVCDCTKDWTGVDNSSCHQQDCLIEKNKHKLRAGCIPVYHENRCCPIEYYCPENLENSYSIVEVSDISKEEASVNGSQCLFGGTLHPIGTDISMNNPCIKCSCQVPPDFTCVHQSCPKQPGPHCFPTYTDNQCCPVYECLLGDESSDARFSNDSSEAICPTPLCADKSCVIGILPGHECPTCICDDSREKNDLEPLYEEREPNYIESKNESHTLDNEILSPLIPESFVEREPLAQIFGEDSNPEVTFVKESEDANTELEELPEVEESAHDQTELESAFEETTPQLEVEAVSSTAASNELRQKRSENYESAANSQQQWNVYQQDQLIEDPEDSNGNSEREMEGNGEGFDEIKVLSTKNAARKALDELVELEENELENVIWTTEVAGCPAPMCADSSCRVGIPPEHTCPTCVCKKQRNRQP